MVLNLLLLAAVLYFHVLAPMLAPAEVAPPPPKKWQVPPRPLLPVERGTGTAASRYRDR